MQLLLRLGDHTVASPVDGKVPAGPTGFGSHVTSHLAALFDFTMASACLVCWHSIMWS